MDALFRAQPVEASWLELLDWSPTGRGWRCSRAEMGNLVSTVHGGLL